MIVSHNINILIGYFILANIGLIYKENKINLIKFYYEQLNTKYYYRKIKKQRKSIHQRMREILYFNR